MNTQSLDDITQHREMVRLANNELFRLLVLERYGSRCHICGERNTQLLRICLTTSDDVSEHNKFILARPFTDGYLSNLRKHSWPKKPVSVPKTWPFKPSLTEIHILCEQCRANIKATPKEYALAKIKFPKAPEYDEDAA